VKDSVQREVIKHHKSELGERAFIITRNDNISILDQCLDVNKMCFTLFARGIYCICHLQ